MTHHKIIVTLQTFNNVNCGIHAGKYCHTLQCSIIWNGSLPWSLQSEYCIMTNSNVYNTTHMIAIHAVLNLRRHQYKLKTALQQIQVTK